MGDDVGAGDEALRCSFSSAVVREEEKNFDARKDDAFDFGSVESFVDDTDIVGATTVGECGGEGDDDGGRGGEGGALALSLPPSQTLVPRPVLATAVRTVASSSADVMLTSRPPIATQ